MRAGKLPCEHRFTAHESRQASLGRYPVGGMYTRYLEKLSTGFIGRRGSGKDEQLRLSKRLIRYYETGSLAAFNDYCIAWVNDTARGGFVNGFIGDSAITWASSAAGEGLVNFKNMGLTLSCLRLSPRMPVV